ncbi:Putative flippase GtrA (transmembrane translocase of bactoprenol-linked glucose) [Pseudomonas cedrina]|uniref:GtrA/DPMS transmembrane domain-containing protein n=2 Tax=Pseudomonas cedrina TaxID=651740 RepID=A0A1V2KGD3_PSECE|nr:GtrA family protein [Pseudomonas cedrina]ONH56718.1 hypothetical protein BLL36_04900 [Pseudomonas cedrina subsp. cedrina]SDS15791.1 Putative flippase GtrA (transmembrane translocase of bactoprenol-linked glucose) [Pseudomonas cedrina]
MIGQDDTQKKVLRFCATGLLVTSTHAFIVWLMVGVLFFSPPLSNGIAFIIATITSYTINTLWSFSQPLQRHTLYKFICVSIIGFTASVVIAWAAQALGLNYFLGIVGVVLTVPVMTFILHSTWTYRENMQK